jgi:hypothetical protein
MTAIKKYFKEGSTIQRKTKIVNGNEVRYYTVFTPETKEFDVNELSDITEERVLSEISKNYNK